MTVPAVLPPHDPEQAVHVLARKSPFRSDVARLVAPPGLSIAELADQALADPIARNLAQATLVGPDGSEWPVPRERWHVVRPRPGIELLLVMVPRGGSFRGIVRIALTIAIVVAAAALTAAGGPLGGISLFGISGLGSTLIGAGITIAGSLLVNALIPVETPRLADLNGTGAGEIAKTSPTLTGSSNAARPWQPVPRVYGRHRVTPPKAARDVSETVGNETYLRCLFDFGYGPLELSDIRIGTTPITQFEGVETEILQGWPGDDSSVGLFPGAITGANVVGGDLLAHSDPSALMWVSDAAPMWGEAAAGMFAGGGYLPMAYQDELVFTDPPPGARVLLRHTLEGEGAEIAYRVAPSMWGSGSDPMWPSDAGPMFGASTADWLPWPGVLVDPPGGLELRVAIGGGQDRGAIRRLQAALDAPRIDEAFADILIAAGGTRLPIAQAYRGIGAVTVTLQGGTAALSAKLIDKNPTLGPLVQCFDAGGTGVAATVDAVITGY
jgi:hypothetical protein